jgi:hypothetical protein
MGYRSEVGFIFSVDGYDKENIEDREQFKALLGFFKLSEFYSIATSPEYDLTKPDADGTGIGWKDGSVMFYASGWKWYESYPLVMAYQTFWEQMQELSEQDKPISGYFARVGEEMDDIVEETFGEDPNYDFFRPHSYLQLDDTIIGEFESEPKTEEKV